MEKLIDGYGPCMSYLSIVPESGGVQIVVGAQYKDACANHFNKKTVLELAALLLKLGNEMESN